MNRRSLINPRVWLRNSIQAAPKLKQRWRDWLNAPSLDEIVQQQGRVIQQLTFDVSQLKRSAKNQYLASEVQALDTGPAIHSAGTHDCNRA